MYAYPVSTGLYSTNLSATGLKFYMIDREEKDNTERAFSDD